MHEKSRLTHSRRTFKVGVEGRKGMRREPATLRDWKRRGREHRLRLTRGREHRELFQLRRDERRNPTARIQSNTVSNELGSRKMWGCTQHRLSGEAMLDEMTCSLGRVR